MKLSGFHKSIGHHTELILDYGRIEQFDKIYISKVFTDTHVPEELLNMQNVSFGGTGFFYDIAPPLPEYIEHHMPDYELYKSFVETQLNKGQKKDLYKFYIDYSIGFLTRGCFRKCGFCVNKNSTKSEPASPLKEFFNNNRKKLCFLDDNFLACTEWERIFDKVLESGKRFQFRQGLDIRIMQKKQMQKIFQGKHDGNVIFAFDDIKDQEMIKRKLDLLYSTVSIGKKELKFYVLCGFDKTKLYNQEFWVNDIRNTLEKIKVMMHYGCLPYIMRFEKWKDAPEPYRGMYITIGRWCNQPAQYTKRSLWEFCIAEGEFKSSFRYCQEFKKKHSELSDYLDMKFEEISHGKIHR